MTIGVRALSPEETGQLAELARSRKRGAGLVRRAQIVLHAVEEQLSAPEIAARMGLCGETVRFWLKRFNERGLGGLEEDMRSGRPPTYTAEERSAVIAAALSRPAALGLPFASWTLDRLVAYLGEKGIGMKRSRVSEVLLAEGRKWRQEETWFGARVDPQFERKRGRSSASTPPRLRAASSSASTRWGHSPPRATPAGAWSSRPVRKRSGPSRRSTTAGAAWPATCSAPFSRLWGTRSPPPMSAAPPRTGWISSARSRLGSTLRSSGSTPLWTTSTPTARPTCCSSLWPTRAGSSYSSPSMRPT